MKKQVVVIGAGMVGVACALELLRRGHDVTLLERRAPGGATSAGNAGVIARSSLMPINNPALWKSLPRLARNRSAALRYNPAFLARNGRWTAGFLQAARGDAYLETAAALDQLIRISTDEHRRLMQEAGIAQRFRNDGWIFAYRSQQAFDGAAIGRDAMDRFGVKTHVLDRAALSDLEPGLKPVFERGLWIEDAMSVDSPSRVVDAYARMFVDRGGRLVEADVRKLSPGSDGGWLVATQGGPSTRFDEAIVALGPWSRDFLRQSLGCRIPMAFERGYFMEYRKDGDTPLHRPVYDTGGAYVLSPMQDGIRLTTGVELTHQDAPAHHAQLVLAEHSAREAFPITDRIHAEPVLNCRPTLPDSRPMIGPAPNHPGLWFAFGHQHIGFSTGPGTARIIGAMIDGDTPAIETEPFDPARFA